MIPRIHWGLYLKKNILGRSKRLALDKAMVWTSLTIALGLARRLTAPSWAQGSLKRFEKLILPILWSLYWKKKYSWSLWRLGLQKVMLRGALRTAIDFGRRLTTSSWAQGSLKSFERMITLIPWSLSLIKNIRGRSKRLALDKAMFRTFLRRAFGLGWRFTTSSWAQGNSKSFEKMIPLIPWDLYLIKNIRCRSKRLGLEKAMLRGGRGNAYWPWPTSSNSIFTCPALDYFSKTNLSNSYDTAVLKKRLTLL